MNKELIEKLLSALLVEESSPKEKGGSLIGEYVIVRCQAAGVHAGTLVRYEGREVELKNSRRLWSWVAGNKSHSLSGVAANGITSASKIPPQVNSIILTEACEIISTTKLCEETITGAVEYVVK